MTPESNPSAAPSEPDLTFQWPAERGFPFILFLCVAGSLFAHLATFFLFQVVYPQRVTIPQPAPHVSLLTPSTPENVALLRWVEAEDPALVATDNAVPPPGLAQVEYRPLFAAARTAPVGAPVEKIKELSFPPAIDRIDVGGPALAPNASASPTPSVTTIRFAGAIAARPVVKNPPIPAPRLAVKEVQSTVLLIGVDSQGEIRFPVLQQSSGDPNLDNLAMSHLSQLGFAPSDGAVTWGHVTFAWGADAYAESTDSAVPVAKSPRKSLQ